MLKRLNDRIGGIGHRLCYGGIALTYGLSLAELISKGQAGLAVVILYLLLAII